MNGDATEQERQNAFERLAMDENEKNIDKKPLDYIFSVEILNEGVDIVEVNQVIMLRPTESPIIFIQQLGRGLRKAEGKEFVVIIDFIGNYRKNFMIPIALSGDRSYNKDNIRRYVTEGGRIIPGASTVHFDKISRQKIFQSIDNANFSDIKLIRENYRNLKDKLGHIPALVDFDKYGEMDVLRIFDNNSLGSYYKFLVKYEKGYTIRLSEDEEKVIEFISKKLASGADHIVLDVKVGKGAFMKNVDMAEKLAKAMVEIGRLANRDTVATLTDMSEPLGCAVGNALEVEEAINTLKGKGPKDFTDLCIALTNEILLVCNIAKTEEEAMSMTIDAINSGKGLEKFKQMVAYQNGDINVIDDYSLFNVSKNTVEVVYEDDDAYVSEIDALKVGESAMLLGAGRETKESKIDMGVGIVLNKKVGDFVKSGDVLATLYVNEKNVNEAIDMLSSAYVMTNEKVEPIKKIIEVIR